jgi:ABC-type transport system involved in cytochrome bd biosynthesis fused ATPase/permease subunit
LAAEQTALLNRMAGNLNQILPGLIPYVVPAFFSLLVAIAWVIAFARIKHVGALALAVASLLGSILSTIKHLYRSDQPCANETMTVTLKNDAAQLNDAADRA